MRWKPTAAASVTAAIWMTPLVEQPLHPLAGGRLGQADGPGDRRVRAPAVLLELLDDPLAQPVEPAPAVTDRRPTVLTDRGVHTAHDDGF